LRSKYTYVFTTGGIGPTHDDITADCVAAAFGVDLPIHSEAEKLLLDYFKEREIEANSDRMRMARIPVGASLVDNPVSVAPGFQMDNVFVFAGVPRIMQAMLDLEGKSQLSFVARGTDENELEKVKAELERIANNALIA